MDIKSTIIGGVKSKTMWFGLGLVVVGQLEAHSEDIASMFSPEYTGLIISGIGMVVWFFRMITKDSLVDKAEKGGQKVPPNTNTRFEVGKGKPKFGSDEPAQADDNYLKDF